MSNPSAPSELVLYRLDGELYFLPGFFKDSPDWAQYGAATFSRSTRTLHAAASATQKAEEAIVRPEEVRLGWQDVCKTSQAAAERAEGLSEEAESRYQQADEKMRAAEGFWRASIANLGMASKKQEEAAEKLQMATERLERAEKTLMEVSKRDEALTMLCKAYARGKALSEEQTRRGQAQARGESLGSEFPLEVRMDGSSGGDRLGPGPWASYQLVNGKDEDKAEKNDMRFTHIRTASDASSHTAQGGYETASCLDLGRSSAGPAATDLCLSSIAPASRTQGLPDDIFQSMMGQSRALCESPTETKLHGLPQLAICHHSTRTLSGYMRMRG